MDISARIAFSHTTFNIIIVSLFLPSIALLAKFIQVIVPEKVYKEKLHLSYFDVGMAETPALGIQQSFEAIIKMGNDVNTMMGWLRKSIADTDENKNRDNKIFRKEKELDLIQKEIVQFVGKMLSGALNRSFVRDARKQLRMADELESVSDYIEDILKLRCRLHNDGLSFNKKGLTDLLELHDMVAEYLDNVLKAVQTNNTEILTKAITETKAITHRMKRTRNKHLHRLEKNETSPLQSLNYLDMLNAYRRIKDHTFNIAEVLAGEK
jgi:phosphate:Na+ symporter